MNKIRLRLAPSPTGFLHLGNLRTALFGYLLTKNLGGVFILRLEDTDQKREVPGALDNLIKILDWVGIKFDEGPHLGGTYGPYIQSQRLDIYKKYIEELLAKGGAYRCWCSPEELTRQRTEQAAKHEPPRYNRACRNLNQAEIDSQLASGAKFVIRQAMPLEGEVKFRDELRGEIVFSAKDLEDHVLIKSDGVPTYQFASVVDDYLMKISHVTRGDEWLPSAPKNVLLYQSFGWPLPKFIHLSLILNKSGGKLSKRQGDVFVEDYQAKGYLPEALINFCALLGWHSKNDQEIFSMAELIKEFTVEGLGASPAIFDEEKLNYFNGHYLRQKQIDDLVRLCKPYLTQEADFNYLRKIIALEQPRLKNLSEIKDKTTFFFQEPDYGAELLIWKNLSREAIKNNLLELQEKIELLVDFNKLEEGIMSWLKDHNKKNGDYLWPLRVALTGRQASPGPFEVALALGKDKTLARIIVAINKL